MFLSVDHFYLSSTAEQDSTGYRLRRLETVDLSFVSVGNEREMRAESYLDRLGVKLEAVLCDQELLNIFALVTLKLDHLAHLTVRDDGAIASYHLSAQSPHCLVWQHTELLLDDLEDLLLVELFRKTLDS